MHAGENGKIYFPKSFINPIISNNLPKYTTKKSKSLNYLSKRILRV